MGAKKMGKESEEQRRKGGDVAWGCEKGPSCPSSLPGRESSHPWRIKTCQRGNGDTARSRRTGLATFSTPADVFFISRSGEGWRGSGGGGGGLPIWSTAPANWPVNARQSRLMSLPTQINASATTAWMLQLIWRRFGKELSNLFMHFMIYVNERGGCN